MEERTTETPIDAERRRRSPGRAGWLVALLAVAAAIGLIAWALAGTDSEVLVVAPPGSDVVALEQGDAVRVQGTVRPIGSATADARTVLGDRDTAVFIDAAQVEAVTELGPPDTMDAGVLERLGDEGEAAGLVDQQVTVVGEVDELLAAGALVVSER